MASLLATDLLLPALLPLLANQQQHDALSAPTVKEQSEGWLISLAAPGLQPRDTQVVVAKNHGGVSLLKIKSSQFSHALRLPPKADAENTKASLVHGLLRIAVPRLPKRLHNVVVSAEALEPAKPAEGDAPHEAVVTRNVPGIAPSEVKVKVEDEHLVVKAQSEHGFGSYAERFKLPERAVVDKIAASCQHGIVSVRVPVAPEQVLSVTIQEDVNLLAPPEAAQKEEDKADAASKRRIDLLQLAVPGFSASDISAEVRGRVLFLNGHHEMDGSRVVIRRSVALPAGTPPEAVKVVCANGLLGAWLPRETISAAVTETPVSVTDEPLSFPAASEGGAGSRQQQQQEQQQQLQIGPSGSGA